MAYVVGVRRRDHKSLSDQSVSNETSNGSIWSKIWNLQVTNKIKMFVWRFAHNSLPVQTKIARRGVKRVDTRCPVCLRFDEDCGHLFSKCKIAKDLWRRFDLEDLRVAMMGMNSAFEAVSYIMVNRKRKDYGPLS
ncbi:hypothetical protein PR202_gb07758 [Eleusine coracana subsp. coracana]|uniref:Reverse transcriptase zinc-binding domain-containing protein n=1 Tax=Eleusine coracana subsp. coracana TaxID=191504 RepID=A0AAV5EC91_ELECO|nr:hypothetical protein PR202_gb07758 [Eleusine coracana subsp. coracana]